MTNIRLYFQLLFLRKLLILLYVFNFKKINYYFTTIYTVLRNKKKKVVVRREKVVKVVNLPNRVYLCGCQECQKIPPSCRFYHLSDYINFSQLEKHKKSIVNLCQFIA